MGKLKQTKIKHRKHKKDSDNNSDRSVSSNTSTTKKYKILTSKNKNKLVLKEGRYYRKNDSINKKNKRSKKHFNMRTLDALKKYGSELKNQDGGFIINYLRFKWNMRKIKKIIAKLGKNQVEINKYIDSYKTQPETFKRLGDKKAVIIYDILRTQKEKTIIEFLLENKDKEKTYDTSNMEHDLTMINTKIAIALTNQLKEINAQIKKEKPQLAQNLTLFKKNSTKFEKINEDYSKIMAFYVEQKELSDKYHVIEKLEHLTKYDKQTKKKYLKNEENIKYILNKDNLDINVVNENIKKIATLMNMSRDYDDKFKDLTQEKYETDLQKWQTNYKDIYVNITEIEGGIKSVSDTLDKIKEYAEQIGFNLSSIYTAIKQSFKLDPILKIKRIIDENLGYLKNIKEVSLKKVKYAFIEQIPIEQIEFYLPLASAALIQTEKSMNELNTSFILDSSFIRTGHAGGWRDMSVISGGDKQIRELEWFGKGGAGGAGVAIAYKDLRTYTIDKFLDTEYENMIATLDQIKTDMFINPTTIKETSPIFKLKNSEFLDIMKIYFNIYIFFLNILNRDHNNLNTIINKDDFNDKKTDILKLIEIILIYEKLDPNLVYSNTTDLSKEYIKKKFIDCNPVFINLTNNLSLISNTYKKYFNDKNFEKNLNPFIMNKKFTIKNLYYEYNQNDDTSGNLDCIKEFIGYYNTKSQNILDFIEEEKCVFDEENLFNDESLLHNSKYYNNMPILYKNTDDTYQFVTIYYDEDSIKPKTSIKKYTNFDKIKQKYKEFIKFINDNFKTINQAITIESTSTEINKLNNDIVNDNTILNTPFHLLYNDKIENYINTIVNEITDVTDNYKALCYNYIKYIIINDWSKDYLIGHDRFNEFYTRKLNDDEEIKNKISSFRDLVSKVTDKDKFYKECMPYLLSSIYNNIGIKDNLYSEKPDAAIIDVYKELSKTAKTKAAEYNKKALSFKKLFDELVLVKSKATINTKYYNDTYRNEHICKFINLFIQVSNAIDEMVNTEAGRILKAFNCAAAGAVDNNETFKTLQIKNEGVEPNNVGGVDAAAGVIQYKTAGIAAFANMAGQPVAGKFINKFIYTDDLDDKLNLIKDIKTVHDEIIELPSQPLIKVANILDTLLKDPISEAIESFDNLLKHFKAHTEKQIEITATLNELTDTINIDPHKPDDNLFKVLKKDDEEMYVVLYKYNPKDLVKELTSNDNMRKYFFTWLKSEINPVKLEHDYMSEFIDNVCCSDSTFLKTPLTDLNFNKDTIDKIDEDHIFLKHFPDDNKDNIVQIIKDEYNSLITPGEAKKLDILGLKIEDKNLYTTSKTIPERKEDRLYFNLPQSDEINTAKTYTAPQLNSLSSKVKTTLIKSYPQIKKDYIKRIVSFNIHYWNNLKLQPSHPLLTHPENTIAFIEEYLPNTDIIGLLDYCLYPKDSDAKRHIQKPPPTDDTNTIQVSNKSISDLISQKLKLNKYIIKNDYYGIQNTDRNPEIFVGKAIYYDNTTSVTDELVIPIDPTDTKNVILYSKVKINQHFIGLYLVNLYTTPDKVLIEKIKEEIEKHRDDSSEINEIVIMGNFNLDFTKHKNDFDSIITDPNYSLIGNTTSTFIDNERRDLCFVSKAFKSKFTILNQNNIVVPSGSISSHYPLYLDIIENEDTVINESNVRTIERDGTIMIEIPSEKLIFILKPKKSSSMPGGASKSLILSTNYVLEKITKNGVTITDVSKDPLFKDYKIEIEDRKIIKFINVEGKLKYSINEEGILTTFKNDGTSIESITMRDPKNDKVFINKDADGKEISISEVGTDGKVSTKDSSTGDYVKTYYEEDDDEVEKAKKEGKRLLSTFMDDVKKENLTMVSKNRDSILSYIKKSIDLIQTRLKPKNYEAIKFKLDALAKNIIELKAIEPKLTPDKVLIKDYAQKARSYDWMEDVTKREKISLSLHDEAKELEAIIEKHPEIKNIVPSSSERLTKEEIQELILAIPAKTKILNKSDSINKILKKIQSKDNMNLVIKYLNEHYISNTNELCRIANTIHSNSYTKEMSELIQKFDCSSKEKEEYEKKKEQKKY